MSFVIPIQNQFAYNTIPRNRDLKLKINNHCNSPSRMLLIDFKGDCFVCGCEAWLPISIGKITDFEKLEDVWNSPAAQTLQKDIDNGSYNNCAVDRCGVIHRNIKFDRYEVSINIDESCNLVCPSCRSESVMITSGPEHTVKLERVNHIVKLLENFEHPVHVVMSGNGDALASSIMRPLIHKWRPGPNQTLRLFTNGLLLRKQLTDSPVIDHVSQYFISIDAGSKDVYEIVRQPGKWENLIDNLDFLQGVAKKTGAEVLLKFVFQATNWNDTENFAKLCKHYGFKGHISKLENWGSFGNMYNQHDVLGSGHPDRAAAEQELKRVLDIYYDPEQLWVDHTLLELDNILQPRK